MKRKQPSLQAPSFPWHALPSSSPDLIVKVRTHSAFLSRGQQWGSAEGCRQAGSPLLRFIQMVESITVT